jgi:hypothetical protein
MLYEPCIVQCVISIDLITDHFLQEYYVSGTRIEKAKKAFRGLRMHKYQLYLDENTVVEAVEDGPPLRQDPCSSSSTVAPSVSPRKTAKSPLKAVKFQPLTVEKAKQKSADKHFGEVLSAFEVL